jgi:3-deoxy-7-phosphoheptulonate synthase
MRMINYFFAIFMTIVVNPDKEWGRVTMITRYGAKEVRDLVKSRPSNVTILAANSHLPFAPTQIDKHLSGHIGSVQKSGHPVAWICDPMHGK